MESSLGKRVISTFPVGSGMGGKWDQLRGWGKGGRRWRRAGPGDGLPDGEGKNVFFGLSGNRSPHCTCGGDVYLSCPGVAMIGGRNERGAVCLQSKSGRASSPSVREPGMCQCDCEGTTHVLAAPRG